MADLAREEAERYLSDREHHTAHPEDRDNDSDRSSSKEVPTDDCKSDPGTDDDDLAKMATMTTTRTTYTIPSATRHANTGPKGVIADAQHFARAKQSTFRQRIASFASTLTSMKGPAGGFNEYTSKQTRSNGSANSSSGSDLALSDDEADSEFMRTWRANRLAELQSGITSSKRQHPSQRNWGTFVEVDANGYLDAIEKVSNEVVVIVLIFDPDSSASRDVEDELSMLACKHTTTRFVKLHHEIAEMETVQIPAVLAYRAGDVFATISDAKAEGLEGVLLGHRVLK